MSKPRLLKADEIEVRIGSINEKGATLLLYKNSRTDMDILDETFGQSNWQRDHKELKGNIYAGVSVWDDKKSQWVTKWDAGTESQTEAVKGESSDSFKRACVNWGIGRELYSSPFIWISSDAYNVKINPRTKKPTTYDKFEVKEIDYTERTITKLVILNSTTKRLVYHYGDNAPKTNPKPPVATPPTKEQLDTIFSLAGNQGMSMAEIGFKINKIKTSTMADAAIKKLMENY